MVRNLGNNFKVFNFILFFGLGHIDLSSKTPFFTLKKYEENILGKKT
jgi:hypothetical protein